MLIISKAWTKFSWPLDITNKMSQLVEHTHTHTQTHTLSLSLSLSLSFWFSTSSPSTSHCPTSSGFPLFFIITTNVNLSESMNKVSPDHLILQQKISPFRTLFLLLSLSPLSLIFYSLFLPHVQRLIILHSFLELSFSILITHVDYSEGMNKDFPDHSR